MINQNNNDIDRIVGELISLEPELNDKKVQLRELVEKLLEAKPNVKVDSHFAERLRRELLTEKTNPTAIPIANFNQFMSKLKYALGGSMVMAVLVIVAIVAVSPKGNSMPTQKIGDLLTGENSSGVAMISLAPNAFGNLSATIANNVSISEAQSAVKGFGGGGGVPPAALPLVAAERDAVSIYPEIYDYVPATMKYTGEPLAELPTEMTLYRRMKEMSNAALSSAVAAQNNGLVHLSGLSNLNVNSVSLKHSFDGQEYGVHLDTAQGTVNINLEYGPRGYDYVPGKELPDEELIALANAFLDRYGVDRSGYAEPQVDKSWLRNNLPGETAAVPDFVQVNYQLVVDGQPIVAWGNQPFGLQVMIDTGRQRVQNAYNIMTQRFESSEYAIETDTARLLAFAEAGGMNGQFSVPQGNTIEFRLGTPTIHYYQYYMYDEQSGSQELFVPALFFPVLTENNPDVYHPDFIVVPLAKELLDKQFNNTDGPVPMPMPLMKGASSAPIEITTPPVGEPAIIRIDTARAE